MTRRTQNGNLRSFAMAAAAITAKHSKRADLGSADAMHQGNAGNGEHHTR
jgi:hypothetical protein